MVKIVKKIKEFYKEILNLYKSKRTIEMILLSLAFILGFLWPLAGVTIYLITKISNKNSEYGKMGILGAIVNIIVYIFFYPLQNLFTIFYLIW